MIGWGLLQFKGIVDAFLKGCDDNMKDAIEERIDLLSEKGNMCKMPISKPLGGGLFALRIKENRQHVRLIYYFRPNKEIVIVHAFYKTTRTIPHCDINTAKKNMKLIQEREGNIHGITITH